MSNQKDSKRTETQEILSDSEEKFRLLINKMQLGLAIHRLICDKEGNPADALFLDCNHAFEKLINKTKKNIIGRTLLDVLPETEKHWIDKAGEVALTGKSVTYENYAGAINKYLSVVIYRLKELEFATIFEDITDRITATKEIEESKERCDRLSIQSRTFIWETDTKGLYTYVSPMIEKILGYTQQEIIGKKHFYDVHPEDSRESLKEAIFNIMDNQRSVIDFDNPLLRKDGKSIWVTTQAMPMYDTNGVYIGYQGSDRDITDSKELALRREEQEKMREQISHLQRMESIGRLTSGIAHNFSNMLAVIIGHCELALDEIEYSNPLYGAFSGIKQAAEKSAALSKQLLGFSHRQVRSFEELDLNKVTGKIVEMMKVIVPERIEILNIPAKRIWKVVMDESQYDQILINLLINARDSIREKGKITVKLENRELIKEDKTGSPGQYVVLSVSDDGCGITKSDMKRIFEPFYTTKSLDEGTGLGLPTVSSIVEENKGFIKVNSQAGKGSVFEIHLPRYRGDGKTVKKREEVIASPVYRKSILLVEDNISTLELIKRLLIKIGYNVLDVQNPNDAIKLAKKYNGNIDLLFTDVIMPGMNGFQLSEKLTVTYPAMKTLYMSSYPAELVTKTSPNSDDADFEFIQKPFSLENIREKIRNLLDK